MNDTKPTAKAAKTVVSTWLAAAASIAGSDLVAGEIFLEPARVGVGHARGGVGARRVVAAVAGAPLGQEVDAGGQRDEHEDDRDEVGGQAEALVLGRGEDALAVLGDEGILDLVLGLALVDQADDLAALGVGLRGLGDLQRDAAGDAHDLGLDGVERGLGRGRGGRGRGDGQEREQRGEDGEDVCAQAAHERRALAIAAVRNFSEIWPREIATILPWRLITNVSGSLLVPYLWARSTSTSRTDG